MPRRDNGTKQRLIDAAIELFHQKGYDHVTINEIAEAVNIKGSSVYNHFKNKQEIFNTLLEYFKEELDGTRIDEELMHTFLKMKDLQSVLDAMAQRFMAETNNPQVLKMWKILAIERHKNEEAQHFFQKFLIDDAIDYLTDIFSKLAENRFFESKYDNRTLATEYHSFFIFLYFRYFELVKDVNSIATDQIVQLIGAHNRFFTSAMLKEKK